MRAAMGVLAQSFQTESMAFFFCDIQGEKKKVREKKVLWLLKLNVNKNIQTDICGFMCFHGITGLKSCSVSSANLWLHMA